MSITWVHISDFHCHQKNNWDSQRVLKPLTADIEELSAKHALRPDLLFVTGDIAFGNLGSKPGDTLADQYALAATFLDDVRKASGDQIDKKRVFLVPGNHDVDRERAHRECDDWLCSPKTNVEAIHQIWNAGGERLGLYISRLNGYRDFLKSAGYEHLLADPERLIYGKRLEVNGVAIGIGGFNTAWTCCKDSRQEQGRLWMAYRSQLSRIEQDIKDATVRIALFHHPPSWIVEAEKNDIERSLQNKFHFALHGHEHEGWLDYQPNRGTRISALACYQGTGGENGYNIVRFDPVRRRTEVWFRRYDPTGDGFVERPIKGKAEYGYFDSEANSTPNGSTTVVVTARTSQSLKTKKTEQRDVSGRWYTRYDQIDGKAITDEVHLKREGDCFVGSSRNNGVHRYRIRAEVKHGHWLVGTWVSELKTKAYAGALLLHIPPGGDTMRGRWVGSAKGDKIKSGNWLWSRDPAVIAPKVNVPKQKPFASKAASNGDQKRSALKEKKK